MPGSLEGRVKRAHVVVEGEREGGGEKRFGRQFDLLQLGLLEPLGLCPAVLKPDLDLGLREAEGAGELCSLRDGEVLFLPESPLQGQQLGRGEGSSGFSVVLVLPQRAWGRAGESWEPIRTIL